MPAQSECSFTIRKLERESDPLPHRFLPCLTFDKWRQGCIVDEGLQVVETFATCF